jgi:ribonuclease HI
MLFIYTDGSCSLNNKNDTNFDGCGGCATVVCDEEKIVDEIVGHYKNTTNNRMELRAVLNAFKYVESKDEKCEIFIDSAYIVNCFEQKWYKKWLSNGWRTSNRQAVKNVDLWKEIIHIYNRTSNRITITKVKGHSGNAMNERADMLATS